MNHKYYTAHTSMSSLLSKGRRGANMLKYCILSSAFMVTAVGYGWGLDSAIKVVDKASSKVNEVNGAINGLSTKKDKVEFKSEVVPTSAVRPVSTPTTPLNARSNSANSIVSTKQSTATIAPQLTRGSTVQNVTTSDPKQSEDDAYKIKLQAVQDGLNKASAKMPLRGGDQLLYDAAYDFSNNDRQKSFLPPAKRIESFPADKMKLVDEFLVWVSGGMKSFDSQKATALRMEWQKKIQAAREADEITFDASKALDQEACTAASQILSENMAAQYVTSMQEKLDVKKKEYADYKVMHADEIAAAQAAKKKQLEKEKVERDAAIARQKQIEAQKFVEKRAQEEEKKKANELRNEITKLKNRLYSVLGKIDYYTREEVYGRVTASSNDETQESYFKRLQEVVQKYEKEADYRNTKEGLEGKLNEALLIIYGMDDNKTRNELCNEAVLRRESESIEDHLKRMQETVSKYEKEAEPIKRRQELEGKLDSILSKLWHEEGEFKDYEEVKKVKDEIAANEATDTSDAYAKRLQTAIEKYEGLFAKIIERRTALDKKVLKALKYADEKCDYLRFGYATRSAVEKSILKPEHRAELEKLLAGVTQEEFADIVRSRNDRLLFVASQMITDQKILEELLITKTGWLKNRHHTAHEADAELAKIANSALYRNVTSQELFMKLWYKDGDYSALAGLDEDHIMMLNRHRIARRRAVHNKTVDVNGFYIGMTYLDYRFLRYMKGISEDDVSAYFDFGGDYVNKLEFSNVFLAKELGIVNDSIEGISEVTERFVPGGEEFAGEIHVDGETRDTYDIAREEVGVDVDTFWWRNCAKLDYPVKIKLYDGGKLVIEAERNKVELDFTAAEGMMNEDFDESKIGDEAEQGEGGSLFFFVIFIGGVIAILYFFRAKIDAYVVAHPKFVKAWRLTCKAGNVSREYVSKAVIFGKAKIEDFKKKKSK